MCCNPNCVFYTLYVIAQELLTIDHLQQLPTAHLTPQAMSWVLRSL